MLGLAVTALVERDHPVAGVERDRALLDEPGLVQSTVQGQQGRVGTAVVQVGQRQAPGLEVASLAGVRRDRASVRWVAALVLTGPAW